MIQLGIVEIEPSQRFLKVRGETVALGARAFDVLLTLVEAGGEVVSKERLFERVWSDLVVEENNLQVQLTAVRRALGSDRELIQTVARQGYRLTVERLMDATGMREDAPVCVQSETSAPCSTNLPIPVNELIGREQAVDDVIACMSVSRLVTLTGPGGIGKTRLSLEVGHNVLQKFVQGVWLVELGALASPEWVAGRVCETLGVHADQHAERLDAITNHIGDKQLLLMLDNCDQVVGEVASLAQHIVQTAPNAHVLVTSREALGTHGETLYTVAPLDTALQDPADPAAPPAAVQLFITRMRALTAQVPADSRTLDTIRLMCARLDGMPLAIEIAAAWAPVLGVDDLNARLDDRLRVVTDTDLTPDATLDWSFDLLSEIEQSCLCSLAVFSGGFTLDAALAMAPDHLPAIETIESIAALVRKSLLWIDTDAHGSRYRLLQTTQTYLIEKLHERGEWHRTKERHARYYTKLIEPMRGELGVDEQDEVLPQYRRELDNVRAAVEWAVVEQGDLERGVLLAQCAATLMFALSMFEECASVAERALQACEHSRPADPRFELAFLGLRTAALAYTQGPTEDVAQAWLDVREKAARLGETDVLVRSTWGLWLQKWYAGEPAESLDVAREFVSIETPYAETVSMLGSRMTGVSLHFAGDQPESRKELERVVALYDRSVHVFPMMGTRLDQKRAARVTLARVMWLQGDLDRAVAETRRLVEDCEDDEPPLLVCYALLEAAIPIALMLRRWDIARHYSEELQRRLATSPVPIWQPCADCFADLVSMRSLGSSERLDSVKANLARMRDAHFLTHLSMVRCLLAEALGAAGLAQEGLHVVNEAIERCELTGERWCFAELLRVRAELSTQVMPSAFDAAQSDLMRGIDLAQSQGALFWELRLRKSLARLWRETTRFEEAREGLRGIYGKFRFEAEVADLIAARLMLSAMDR